MSATLQQVLAAALAASPARMLCVAFSGGPDSTALLHALTQRPEAQARGLRALHVDHGLHANSTRWAERCNAFCASIDVPLTTVRVEVEDARGEGMEAAARRARYAAFAEHLGEGEWLVLAHHRDDQIETVLLKLLRGAGPNGLGGMRALRPFACGFLWRPLLDTPRAALRNYLAEHALSAIDDPANADPRFMRNVLRREILPLLTQHWPHAGASILHASLLCRAAADHLQHEAESALPRLRRDDGSLDSDGWLMLPEVLRAHVLDDWLRGHGLPVPPDAPRAELTRQAAHAAAGTAPCVAWRGAEVRIWDGRLHAMPALATPPENWHSDWNGDLLILPAGCGSLRLDAHAPGPAHDAPRVPPLVVRFRRGGERIKPAGDAHTRELRDLFQQARVPPWVRARCPLIFVGDALVAVADLWLSACGKAIFDACGMRPRWQRPDCAAPHDCRQRGAEPA